MPARSPENAGDPVKPLGSIHVNYSPPRQLAECDPLWLDAGLSLLEIIRSLLEEISQPSSSSLQSLISSTHVLDPRHPAEATVAKRLYKTFDIRGALSLSHSIGSLSLSQLANTQGQPLFFFSSWVGFRPCGPLLAKRHCRWICVRPSWLWKPTMDKTSCDQIWC